MKTWDEVREFVHKHYSQAHLAVCNTKLFETTLVNGVYGFPHSGDSRKKSFWRSIASLYNIGPNDLIFIYRMNGPEDGCKEIHGPFKIHCIKNESAIYYDKESSDLPMHVGDKDADCKVRFMFEKIFDQVSSIANNFELIKLFETREIWGYRHPAVMNIGAARKKSVTSYTTKQTLKLIDLLETNGKVRHNISEINLPNSERINNFKKLSIDETHFHLNNKFLLNNYANDEAFYYSHIINAFKNPNCTYRRDTLKELWIINGEMLKNNGINSIEEISVNVMLEIIVTVHLQDELDVVTTNQDDTVMMIYEFKKDAITQESVNQAESYIDLMGVIFPKMKIFSNVIGTELKNSSVIVSENYKNRIKLVSYSVINKIPLKISYTENLENLSLF